MSLDCQKCGACCAIDWVDVQPDDKVDPSLVTPDGKWMRVNTNGECIAFSGNVGVGCSCSIYNQKRPRICLSVEPGHRYCKLARIYHGLDERGLPND